MPNRDELLRKLQEVQDALAECECDDETPDLEPAFDVMTELRAQPGVVKMKHGVWQFLIEARGDGSRLEIRKRRDGGVKQSRCFSPAFESERDASRAIDAVGSGRIIEAQKALAWG